MLSVACWCCLREGEGQSKLLLPSQAPPSDSPPGYVLVGKALLSAGMSLLFGDFISIILEPCLISPATLRLLESRASHLVFI